MQEEIHKQSLADPINFWQDPANNLIDWYRPCSKVLEIFDDPGSYQWFPDGIMNTCFNCVDRHVDAGYGSSIALIYDSPVTNTIKRYTYKELLKLVEETASLLKFDYGVRKGDTILIYMPMIPESVISMLACARIGAVHAVVFGGFAAGELSKRISDANPRVILTASHGIEVQRVVNYIPGLVEAIKIANHPEAIVLCRYRDGFPGSDRPFKSWDQEIKSGSRCPCIPLASSDPLYILYTSGTTGAPKGIVRENGGHAVALAWSMGNVFNVRRGECYFAASDIGWVLGHSYIVYAPLLVGASSVLYEGKPVGTPDAGSFWRVVSDHRVKVLFTAPTAARAIKREDFHGTHLSKYDLSCLQSFWLAGERADPETVRHFEQLLKIPVIDNWWQTELGWPCVATCMGFRNKPNHPVQHGSAGKVVPGYRLEVKDVKEGLGSLMLKLPLPPGCSQTIWKNHNRFVETYLTKNPGYYDTMDIGTIDHNGYISIMSRSDDVMKVSGHLLSSGAMEEFILEIEQVAECAVVGVDHNLKGSVPWAFIVLTKESIYSESLQNKIRNAVRTRVGAIASLERIVVVERLPKTRSGKILRNTLRDLCNKRQKVRVPPTIEDLTVVDHVRAKL